MCVFGLVWVIAVLCMRLFAVIVFLGGDGVFVVFLVLSVLLYI